MALHGVGLKAGIMMTWISEHGCAIGNWPARRSPTAASPPNIGDLHVSTLGDNLFFIFTLTGNQL